MDPGLRRDDGQHEFVIPAKAGIHLDPVCERQKWIPAFAGMTVSTSRRSGEGRNSP
jgi:hypothetical protein